MDKLEQILLLERQIIELKEQIRLEQQNIEGLKDLEWLKGSIAYLKIPQWIFLYASVEWKISISGNFPVLNNIEVPHSGGIPIFGNPIDYKNNVRLIKESGYQLVTLNSDLFLELLNKAKFEMIYASQFNDHRNILEGLLKLSNVQWKGLPPIPDFFEVK